MCHAATKRSHSHQFSILCARSNKIMIPQTVQKLHFKVLSKDVCINLK